LTPVRAPLTWPQITALDRLRANHPRARVTVMYEQPDLPLVRVWLKWPPVGARNRQPRSVRRWLTPDGRVLTGAEKEGAQ
jgi:hypothetical protein